MCTLSMFQCDADRIRRTKGPKLVFLLPSCCFFSPQNRCAANVIIAVLATLAESIYLQVAISARLLTLCAKSIDGSLCGRAGVSPRPLNQWMKRPEARAFHLCVCHLKQNQFH